MKCTSKRVVGYWHYGVILTYLSLALSVCGICFAAAYGGPRRSDIAALFLLLAGLCDAFDGMVARTRKNRTADDKMFGIQIDSLSDLVSFGIAPIMVGVAMGMTRWYFCIFYVFYVLCALVRLAYYNVDEAKRISDPESGSRESYLGLPVTNAALAVPIFYLIASMLDSPAYAVSLGLGKIDVQIYRGVIMMFGYALLGILFIVKFRMFKAHARGLIVTILIVTAIVVSLSLVRAYVCDNPLFEPLKRFDPETLTAVCC